MRYFKSGKLITRFERYAFEEDEKGSVEKGPEDYLKTLQKMIFKSKKLNPKGLKAEEHSSIEKDDNNYYVLEVDSGIGGWHYYIEPPKTLPKESLEEFKKIVGAFCKINKCLVDIHVDDDHDMEENVTLTLKKYPNQKVDKPVSKPAPKSAQTTPRNAYDNPDSEWEDPNFQDRRKRASYYSWK